MYVLYILYDKCKRLFVLIIRSNIQILSIITFIQLTVKINSFNNVLIWLLMNLKQTSCLCIIQLNTDS